MLVRYEAQLSHALHADLQYKVRIGAFAVCECEVCMLTLSASEVSSPMLTLEIESAMGENQDTPQRR